MEVEVRFIKDYKDPESGKNYKLGQKAIVSKEEANFLIKASIAIKINDGEKKDIKYLIIAIIVIVAMIGIFIVIFARTLVSVPNVRNKSYAEAKQIIENSGLNVSMQDIYNEDVESGLVVDSDIEPGTLLKKGDSIMVYVSKGPEKVYSTESVASWWHIDGSNNDKVEFENPYIEDGYLYINTYITFDSYYSVKFRGFGTASISDTFNKTVPLLYTYENESPSRGNATPVQIKISVKDLDVQQPTTLYLKLCLMVNDKQYDMRVDFSISW